MSESQASPDWVDDVLLAGTGRDTCLFLGRPIDRAELRSLVGDTAGVLAAAGLARGGSVALALPPSLGYITHLLAAWRLGAQVALLDHRLTAHETEGALARVSPQLVVASTGTPGGALRAYHDVEPVIRAYHAGTPATTGHAVVQLSSGSTGPSKVIGRTAADLVSEVERYVRIDGVPQPGERTVLLASMVHVLGLVGGLLYGLHAGVQLVVPERLTVAEILRAVDADSRPATIIGVPFHIELLAAVSQPPRLPQLKRMTTGGELVRPHVAQAFADRYGVPLGNMYGMTEIGVIATDLFGEHRPALTPAPGVTVRADDGELLLAMPASPYIGLSDPTRWVDGWLHTRDAGVVDPATGLIRVLGRLDSQVSVGGLKVDLSEVEQAIAGLPEVEAAVVVFDGRIEAYLMLCDLATREAVEKALTERLAAYKRPRVLHVVDQLPRTATGKLVRDHAALRAVAEAQS